MSKGSERVTHGRHCSCYACACQDWSEPGLASCGMHGASCPPEYAPLGSAGDTVAVPMRPSPGNLFSGLASLQRMSKHDQQLLDMRLRMLAATAKGHNAVAVAANLLRASYELERRSRDPEAIPDE